MNKLVSALATAVALAAPPAFATDGQTHGSDGPVTLINVFTVPHGKADEAIKFWENAAEFMRKQPGYISTALHQSIQPDAKFQLINVAKWESVEAYKNASRARRTQTGSRPPEGLIPAPAVYTVIRMD